MAPRRERKKRDTFRITHLKFRCNIELKPFQHAHIEAEADVPVGEDPSAVLDKLKLFVAEELRRTKQGRQAQVVREGRFTDILAERL